MESGGNLSLAASYSEPSKLLVSEKRLDRISAGLLLNEIRTTFVDTKSRRCSEEAVMPFNH